MQRPARSTTFSTAFSAVVLALGLLAGAAEAATSSRDVEVRRLGIPEVVASDESVQVDDRGIWQAIDRQDWSLAQKRIDQLKVAFPGWTPSEKITALLSESVRTDKLKRAIRMQDWNTVLALTNHAASTCQPELERWGRAEALFGLKQQNAYTEFTLASLAACDSTTDRHQILDQAIWRLDEQGLDAALVYARNTALEPKLQKRRARLAFRRLADNHQWLAASDIARASGEPNMLSEAAWGLSENHPAKSRELFVEALQFNDADELRYGYALTSMKLGDTAPARAFVDDAANLQNEWTVRSRELAAAAHLQYGEELRLSGDWLEAVQAANRAKSLSPASTEDADRLAGAAFLAAAQSAREAGEIDKALALARQSARFSHTDRDARMLAAWAQLDRGDADAAANAFEALYKEAPEQQPAEGLFAARPQMDDLDALDMLARQSGGPLKGLYNGERSMQARYKGDYLTALAIAPARQSDLSGLDKPSISQSVSTRRIATSGAKNAIITQSRTAFSVPVATKRVEVGLVSVHPNWEDQTTNGAAPYLKIETEGDIKLAAQISTTPIGADIAPVITGEASLRQRRTTSETEASVFRRARDDNATALLGATTDDGIEHGRAEETGIEVRHRVQVTKAVSISGGAGVSEVSSKNAETNARIQIAASAARNIEHDGFAYLSTGPFVSHDSYERNETATNAEHGSYYSPQTLTRAGWGLNLQTKEPRDWIVRMDAAAAFELAELDAAPVAPLSDPEGDVLAGQETQELALSVNLRGVRKLTDQWAIGASASLTQTSQYDDVRVGLTLRYTPHGRAALVGPDLEPDPFSADIF